MKTLKIQGATNTSTILVGEVLKHLSDYVPPATRLVCISDRHVLQHYGDQLPSADVITIGTGEGIKTLDTARSIYRRLVELETDRSVFLVGIGGGIVCDITGFVAATYLRGVRCGYVASSLLAQVDASVGGKTGVNLDGYKNMVGVFQQPEFVICDLELLHSLPPKEILIGMAEIVKHAAIADCDLFDFLEHKWQAALALQTDVIAKLVYESIAIKAAVVRADEREAGQRRLLNFGHTFGHAVEKVARVSHGEAVSIGMAIAGALSVEQGFLEQAALDRLVTLLERIGLPVEIAIDGEQALEALRHDKKRYGDTVQFVLLDRIGHAFIHPLALKILEPTIRRLSSAHDP